MRSLADQTTEELGGRWSILTRQKLDHVKLDELLAQVRRTTGEEQQETLNRMCRLVFPHAFAEEAVLWPALRRHVPGGDDLTAEVEAEHQQINEHVAALERSPLDDPDRERLLAETLELLDQDVRDEEDELLPRLQEALSVAQLRRLGIAWEAVRRTAPTRPHPVVSRRPPGNVLSALPLSALDRTRDALDSASRRAAPPAAQTLRSASRRVADGAGRLEHVPPFRRGQRADT